MSYAIVKNSAGDKFIVSNSIKNAAGAATVVANDVNDSDGNPFTVFGATVAVVPTETFIATPDRIFYA